MAHRLRHAPCFILPPHLLENVAERGSDAQRSSAMNTLRKDRTVRMLRQDNIASGRRSMRTATLSTHEEGDPTRSIYDAGHTENLPGTLIRSEGQDAVDDVTINEAYAGLGATFDMFWTEFGRDSIDDEGLPLSASTHFSSNYDNAFWDGTQMVFGDGDGQIFNRFTISIDVIGHELTHGVTEDEAQLRYTTQSGALNESMSDCFGSVVKQFSLQQKAEEADWLIGAGLFTDAVNGAALRSMKAPGTAYDDPVLGKDPQPADMAHYVHTYDDNGGVHINSGIPNRAFYLCATTLGGYSWERAGRIWYETLRDNALRPTSGFRRFARLTATTASRLYGARSDEHDAVVSAWGEVGIKLGITTS